MYIGAINYLGYYKGASVCHEFPPIFMYSDRKEFFKAIRKALQKHKQKTLTNKRCKVPANEINFYLTLSGLNDHFVKINFATDLKPVVFEEEVKRINETK